MLWPPPVGLETDSLPPSGEGFDTTMIFVVESLLSIPDGGGGLLYETDCPATVFWCGGENDWSSRSGKYVPSTSTSILLGIDDNCLSLTGNCWSPAVAGDCGVSLCPLNEVDPVDDDGGDGRSRCIDHAADGKLEPFACPRSRLIGSPSTVRLATVMAWRAFGGAACTSGEGNWPSVESSGAAWMTRPEPSLLSLMRSSTTTDGVETPACKPSLTWSCELALEANLDSAFVSLKLVSWSQYA